MLRNPEAETFFLGLSAHSDLASAFQAALERLGEYNVRHAPRQYGARFAVTRDTVFCGAAGMASSYWRLGPHDYGIALATGAERAPIGPEWVMITLFRHDWPQPDLAHWALRAYDFARNGS